MNTKKRTRLSKTYDKGSKHNIGSPHRVQIGTRISRELKRKIEKWCEAQEANVDFTEAVRMCLEEEFGKVVLTSDDLFRIAEETKEQEVRNARKIGK